MATIHGKEIGLVYTGRTGCMCGCRGKYSNKPAVISKVVNSMKKYPFDPAGRSLGHVSKMVDNEGCCFSVDYETPGGTPRTLVAYYDRIE